MASNKPFQVQVNSLDSYTAPPKPLDSGSSGARTSVIRVFGTVPTGHLVCIHVHGVLPYFFVGFDHSWSSYDEITLCASKLHSYIENSMRAPHENGSKVPIYIHSVLPCKLTPFYGFHVGYSVFFKVSLLSPYIKNRVLELIQGSGLLQTFPGTPSIYEAHSSYLLQFLCDYNLFGCGWLESGNVNFRRPVFNNTTDELYEMKLTDEVFEFADQYLTDSNTLDYPRTSHTFMEIDIDASSILNRGNIDLRNLHHDFVERLGHTPSSLRYISSTQDLWKEDAFQREKRGIPPYSEKRDIERANAEVRWSEQDDLDGLLKYCLVISEKNSKRTGLSYENFVENPKYLENIPTPFELVDRRPGASNINEPKETDDFFESFPLDDNEDEEEKPEQDSQSSETLDMPENPFENATLDDISFSLENSQTLPPAKRRKHIMSKPRTPFFSNSKGYFYLTPPPSIESLQNNVANKVVPQVEYEDPFFGLAKDVPPRPYVNVATRKKFTLFLKEVSSLPGVSINDGYSASKQIKEFIDASYTSSITAQNDALILGQLPANWSNQLKSYRYTAPKPSFAEVRSQIHRLGLSLKHTAEMKKRRYESQIEFLTPKFTAQASASPVKKVQRRPDSYLELSNLCIEVHKDSLSSMSADVKTDAVLCIFWRIENPLLDLDIVGQGVLAWVGKDFETSQKRISSASSVPVQLFSSEAEMYKGLISLVRTFDPELLSSWDVHSSWSYIISRGKTLGVDVLAGISRVYQYQNNKTDDSYGFEHGLALFITGRHLVNAWRLISKEIALLSYTFENVVAKTLNQRIPHFPQEKLASVYGGKSTVGELCLFFGYYNSRVLYCLEVLEALDIIPKIAEQARLGGVDFHSVFYRGSQFKVESFLLRLSKSENFLLLLPLKKDVRRQKPLECIPLVMEPSSAFYKSPMAVLDFQSLYPSIIIAYNYCYSTCLGRLRGYNPVKAGALGVTKLKVPPGLFGVLKDDIHVSPNGLMFVKERVRKLLLAKMLTELLLTRFMLKSTMKELSDKSMKRVYDNRQLALKLIANVTYGYTSALFSGRMPCLDIADAIVLTGREILQRLVKIIENTQEWNAKVVYGDTDSLFVYFPGRSRQEAFRLARQMADELSRLNPAPITLKFEKIYHPSVLLAKKRYVGYSYESEDQLEPSFDAKGIETVRRDGIPAQQKIVEKSLRILFETTDLSKVKLYVEDQFFKILENRVSIQDFCFAKEVKLGKYKSAGTMPPGAMLVAQKKEKDSGYEPQFRERVPYLILKSYDKNARLKDKAVLLEDVLGTNPVIDGEYYITKMLIPPLHRIFGLIGVDIALWYSSMPRRMRALTADPNGNPLERHLQAVCLTCGKPLKRCSCVQNIEESEYQAVAKARKPQVQYRRCLTICRACSVTLVKGAGDVLDIWCNSADCRVFYDRMKMEKRVVKRRNKAEMDQIVID